MPLTAVAFVNSNFEGESHHLTCSAGKGRPTPPLHPSLNRGNVHLDSGLTTSVMMTGRFGFSNRALNSARLRPECRSTLLFPSHSSRSGTVAQKVRLIEQVRVEFPDFQRRLPGRDIPRHHQAEVGGLPGALEGEATLELLTPYTRLAVL